MPSTLTAIGDESVRLVSGSVSVWLRLLPRLLALCLLGWVAYHGSVFAAVELGRVSAWLLIPVLALGVVARLATVILALRSVAHALDAPRLLRLVAPEEAVDDDRDRSITRLMSTTLLPFLGVYAAFGYVTVFAQDVVLLSTYRFGILDDRQLLGALNPTSSVTAAAITIGLVVGLYLARRLLDRWHEASGAVVVGLLAVVVEACGLFVVLLSGFRLWEEAQLWLGERRLAQWWDDAVAWASGWLRIDLPDVVTAVWNVAVETVWPVFWDLLSQPVAWLALAALVFGSRVLSLGDLWHTTPVPAASRDPRMQRVQAALAGAHGARRVVLQVQEAFLGDIDDKYLPALVALRLVLRAGLPFLGAFVLVFGLVRLAGEWAARTIVVAIGGQPPGTWVRLIPFLDLVPDVIGMSLQLALLGTAFVRILTLRTSPEPVRVPAGARRRLGEVGLVGALLAAVTALTLLNPSARTAERTSAIGEPAGLNGGMVVLDQVRLASGLRTGTGDRVETTPLVFVVVRATVIRPGAEPIAASADLRHGDRSYHAGSWAGTVLTAEAGFRSTGDLVFEVQPSDLDPSLELRFTTPGVLTFYDEVVRVPLGLPAAPPVAGELTVLSPPVKAVA
jgi:hypothetical protein